VSLFDADFLFGAFGGTGRVGWGGVDGAGEDMECGLLLLPVYVYIMEFK
tara:strand:+ start:1686 stop:1832 length:147 start_codon:yes stop_codon:yes gene_type:complete